MKFEQKEVCLCVRERETETEKDVESFLISYHTHYTTAAAVGCVARLEVFLVVEYRKLMIIHRELD